MEYVAMLGLVAVLIAPLLFMYRAQKKGRRVKGAMAVNIVSFFTFCVLSVALGMGGTAHAAEATGGLSSGDGVGLIAAALATGMSCIGAGIAVAASATAALGAISENEKTFGKALIFVALAEGVALYGLLISFQILGRIA